MSLLTPKQRGRLIENGREIDLVPVCKLFYPAGTGAWLITHADPLEPHRLFGLCHHHDGHTPQLGYVSPNRNRMNGSAGTTHASTAPPISIAMKTVDTRSRAATSCRPRRPHR